jgi:hypothetical protein
LPKQLPAEHPGIEITPRRSPGERIEAPVEKPAMVPQEPEFTPETPIPPDTSEIPSSKPDAAPPAPSTGKEAIPTVAQPIPPPKESFPTPLDENALKEDGVRAYLDSTAPILEALSLLMMKAPSLSVVDYDPSRDQSSPISADVLLSMDSMKRELQILDSKTFAIIPPLQYTRFHELIRESIAHTYQACDSIVSFLSEGKSEDLEAMQRHIGKARELIQMTRTVSSL